VDATVSVSPFNCFDLNAGQRADSDNKNTEKPPGTAKLIAKAPYRPTYVHAAFAAW